ncbi:hypothetical protein EDB19DRAFT_1708426, partial [Suillus lakei]
MDRVELLKELREEVMHASADVITSDMSLSPFDADQLSRILELINHLRENAEGNDFPHSICIIARFMNYFYRAKFFNFCGLPCARLDAVRSVYEEGTGLHPLIGALFPFFDFILFMAPQAHVESIQRVWVDQCIDVPRWKDFSRNLLDEWNGIALYSTVMLAVDVSFLAMLNADVDQPQSMEVTAIYLSIIFITGSLLILFLLTQTQRRVFNTADKATHRLEQLTGTSYGVKAVATVHGLPACIAYVGDHLLHIRLSVECVQICDAGHAGMDFQRVHCRRHTHMVVHLGN